MVINEGTNMLSILFKLRKSMVVRNLHGLVDSLVNSHDGVLSHNLNWVVLHRPFNVFSEVYSIHMYGTLMPSNIIAS